MTWYEILWGIDATMAACTWVPPAGEGVCEVCHASARPGKGRCFACFRTSAQVTMPAEMVVPIALYRTRGQPLACSGGTRMAGTQRSADPVEAGLGRLLCRFLRMHLACIAPGASPNWRITVVPPTRRRAQRHPLERVVRRSLWLRRRYVRTLRTSTAPGHNAASDTAFKVVRGVAGLEIVLVDDTFTTGASVQSAVSALRLAGAQVIAVVVIGRVVNPDVSPEEAALWASARRTPWRLNRCCTEGG